MWINSLAIDNGDLYINHLFADVQNGSAILKVRLVSRHPDRQAGRQAAWPRPALGCSLPSVLCPFLPSFVFVAIFFLFFL